MISCHDLDLWPTSRLEMLVKIELENRNTCENLYMQKIILWALHKANVKITHEKYRNTYEYYTRMFITSCFSFQDAGKGRGESTVPTCVRVWTVGHVTEWRGSVYVLTDGTEPNVQTVSTGCHGKHSVAMVTLVYKSHWLLQHQLILTVHTL